MFRQLPACPVGPTFTVDRFVCACRLFYLLISSHSLPLPHFAQLLTSDPSAMADDKKTDDYTVQMDKLDQGNKEFEAAPPPQPRAAPPSPVAGHPALPVLAYCGSSIMMTVMNKYVLSGLDFNLNFLLLMVQVCSK